MARIMILCIYLNRRHNFKYWKKIKFNIFFIFFINLNLYIIVIYKIYIIIIIYMQIYKIKTVEKNILIISTSIYIIFLK